MVTCGYYGLVFWLSADGTQYLWLVVDVIFEQSRGLLKLWEFACHFWIAFSIHLSCRQPSKASTTSFRFHIGKQENCRLDLVVAILRPPCEYEARSCGQEERPLKIFVLSGCVMMRYPNLMLNPFLWRKFSSSFQQPAGYPVAENWEDGQVQSLESALLSMLAISKFSELTSH